MHTYMCISFCYVVIGSWSCEGVTEAPCDTLPGTKSHSIILHLSRRINLSHAPSSSKRWSSPAPMNSVPHSDSQRGGVPWVSKSILIMGAVYTCILVPYSQKYWHEQLKFVVGARILIRYRISIYVYANKNLWQNPPPPPNFPALGYSAIRIDNIIIHNIDYVIYDIIMKH
jgi:hypothetical protein